MKTAHTPGPWYWAEARTMQHLTGKNNTVSCVSMPKPSGIPSDGQFKERYQADARLIAAAPDLLAELENLLYGTDCELDSEGRSVFRFTQAKLARARAAIAKATEGS